MRAAQVVAAHALIYNTAWRDAQGQSLTKEVSMIKALAGTLVNEVMYDCLQFHGGMATWVSAPSSAGLAMHVPRRSTAARPR